MWLPNWKFCRVWGSNPGQTMADFFFGLFVGFLDFLVAPFSRFWYYISVQWSKMYLKRVILLIAWFGHIYDHCVVLCSSSSNFHKFGFLRGVCVSKLQNNHIPSILIFNTFFPFLLQPQLAVSFSVAHKGRGLAIIWTGPDIDRPRSWGRALDLLNFQFKPP